MYGEVVDGVDGHRFERRDHGSEGAARGPAGRRARRRRPARADRDVPADLRGGDGWALPAGREGAAAAGDRAVFDSWDAPRAQVYRRTYEIPDDIGTAVNVVQMVFGNKGESSGTGVCFTRDPSTGEAHLYGEYLVNAQGEDVVAGIRTPEPISALKKRMPEAYTELTETLDRLEAHYRDMQDIEFTVEEGKLYLLQTRTGKRTAQAALRIAVEMAAEGLISQEEAVARDRSGPARPAAASDDRPDGEARGGGEGTERLARRGVGRDRARRRHGRGARQGGRRRDPRPLGDDAGRHPRADPGARRPHRSRRHDLARCRRRARHGQAVRGRLRGSLDRRARRIVRRSASTR